MALSRRSLEVLLDLVGEVVGLLDIVEFRRGLLPALRRTVPSDWASLNDVGPDGAIAVSDPEAGAEWYELFSELSHQNPLYQRLVRTQDGRPYRFSDVVSRRELESTELWRRFYAPLGVNHQIAFTLPHRSGRVMAIALSRRDPDYTDLERELLDRARPFLIQAYRNALVHTAAARLGSGEVLESALTEHGLTAREAEVVHLIALGGSNHDIADRLGLSERTVHKHVEHAFRKLGVASRSAAAARAWELLAARPVHPIEGSPPR